MPQLWQKEALYANSRWVKPKNAFIANCDGGVGGVLLSNGDDKLSIGGNIQNAEYTPILRKTGRIAYWRKRYSSAVLRYKCQRSSSLGQPTSDNTLHEGHSLRHQNKPGVGPTFCRRFANLSKSAVGGHHQTKQWTGRLIHGHKRTSEKRKLAERRGRGNRIVNQLLNIKRDVYSAFVAPLRAALLFFMLAALMPLGAANAAASLVIKPTRIVITEEAPVAVITIENQGNTEAVLQMQLMSWGQESGEDVYGPSDTLGVIACPSMFNIPAGESQIVRIGLEDMSRDWGTEGTFRLFIQEIPSQPAEDATAVQVAMRIGIPVFLPPTNFVKPALNWQIKTGDQGGTWMTVVNEGTSHALISGIQLKQEEFLFQTNTHQYVLPGATISWRLDLANPITGALPGSVDMIASTDQGSYEETLQIGK